MNYSAMGTVRATVQKVLSFLSRILFGRRVPLRKQMSQVECGAASLAMVLSYYGRNTKVAETREHCDVGRDGLTALTIAQAARSYGLRAKGYTLELEDIGQVRLPAILHWGFNHFVVLEKWSPKRAVIMDPAVGRRRLTPTEFDESFTGVVLTLEPGAQFQKRKDTSRKPWREYLGYALATPGTYGSLCQILLASGILAALGLVVPLVTKILVDEILPMQMGGAVGILALGVGVIGLALVVTNYLRGVLVVYLQAKLDSQLMLNFFEHTLSLPFRFFQQRSSGDMMVRLSSNSTIQQMITNQTVSIVLDSFLALTYAAILFFMAPFFGLAALGLGLVQIATLVLSARPMHALMQRDLEAQSEAQGYMVESLTGIETLKASGAEHRALDHWSNLFFKQLNLSLKRGHLEAVISTITSTIRSVSPVLLLLIGAVYVLGGAMTLGTMLALQAIATQFLNPLSSLVTTGQQLQVAGAHIERITDVTQAEPEQPAEGKARKAPPLSGRIELKDVSFRYDQNTSPALRDVSLTIEPGQKIALVGRSGSGKSTFAKLLLGLYEPTEGEILYDGIPLQAMDYRSLRSQFGTVMQDSSVFGGSMKQNISFNDPDLPFEEVKRAAELAAIDEDIQQMPMGYETPVSESGGALSGGQRQRLALARALAHRPVLLALDEATSHLDADTERQVSQSISALSCTRVVAAHRLSTIRDANLILVLEEGEIVERGTHQELLVEKGYYAELIEGQLEKDTNEEVSL